MTPCRIRVVPTAVQGKPTLHVGSLPRILPRLCWRRRLRLLVGNEKVVNSCRSFDPGVGSLRMKLYKQLEQNMKPRHRLQQRSRADRSAAHLQSVAMESSHNPKGFPPLWSALLSHRPCVLFPVGFSSVQAAIVLCVCPESRLNLESCNRDCFSGMVASGIAARTIQVQDGNTRRPVDRGSSLFREQY